MAKRKLLTNGNAFKRTDGRWGGTVGYMDDDGERKRKSFSGTTKQEVTKKMASYVENFNAEVASSTEANKKLSVSMQNWLKIFKFQRIEFSEFRSEPTVNSYVCPTTFTFLILHKYVRCILAFIIPCGLKSKFA